MTHEHLMIKCLQLLIRPDCLKEDICNVQKLKTLWNEIDSCTINNCLSEDVRYACHYWMHHWKESKNHIHDQDQVHTFLQKYFLHWLEAASLMAKMSEVILMIDTLQSLFNVSHSNLAYHFLSNADVSTIQTKECNKIFNFFYDAKHFVLKNKYVIEAASLQTYSSAIIFTFKQSIIRKIFKYCIFNWIQQLPKIKNYWSAALQSLKSH